MSVTSNLDAIVQQTLAAVNGLNLTLNSTGIPAAIGKVPKREEVVDPATQITISQSQAGPKTKPMGANPAGGKIQERVDYPVMITIITPNNDDQVGNLQQYFQWHEQIRILFKDKTVFVGVVPSVWDTQVEQGTFLNRKLIPLGYDYLETLVTVTTVE